VAYSRKAKQAESPLSLCIEHFGRTRLGVDLARTHLLDGDAQTRTTRIDARTELRTASRSSSPVRNGSVSRNGQRVARGNREHARADGPIRRRAHSTGARFPPRPRQGHSTGYRRQLFISPARSSTTFTMCSATLDVIRGRSWRTACEVRRNGLRSAKLDAEDDPHQQHELQQHSCEGADLDERCGRALAGIRYCRATGAPPCEVMRESPELAAANEGSRFSSSSGIGSCPSSPRARARMRGSSWLGRALVTPTHGRSIGQARILECLVATRPLTRCCASSAVRRWPGHRPSGAVAPGSV